MSDAALLATLRQRFEGHMVRHPDLAWADVEATLVRHPTALASLRRMEDTGGAPDAVRLEAGALTFVDCAPESPAGRRSLCYDHAARHARKAAAPAGSAQELAAEMGVTLLTEAQYHRLQQFGAFDTRTSSWLDTPAELRSLGGALFGDRRYQRVFVYHNCVQSYYAARGFRGVLRL